MTARPGVPSYLHTPYSDKDIGPNGVPLPPLGATQGGSGSISPAPTVSREIPDIPKDKKQSNTRIRFDLIEEKPVPPETEDALFQAADKAYRIAAGRIKFHEMQLKRWRAVGAAFAGLSEQSADQPAVMPADMTQQFLDLMKQLPEDQS